MAGLLSKLVKPRYPATALGFEKGLATMVQLERARNGAHLKRAATVALPESLILPSFDQSNISDPAELRNTLSSLAANAGLLQQKRWSMTLPEAASRSAIVTLESRPSSSSELEEVLRWKMERAFGQPLEDLSVSRERLPADAQGRDRYLVVATHRGVVQEFEDVLHSLGWRAGLILPRHMGEGQWLTMNGAQTDSLLISSSSSGFTALVFRGKQPLIVRAVDCDPEECEDELFRLLLYYRERQTDQPATGLTRVLVIGSTLSKARVCEIVNETLETDLRPLDAGDVGLQLASSQMDFDAIAAPAGLATLSWQ